MHFIKEFVSLVMFTAVTAIPVSSPNTEALVDPAALEDYEAIVNVYCGNTCDHSVDSFFLVGAGASTCRPYSNTHSIQATANNCKITTWSGNNCQGSSKVIPDSACLSVPFASVSIQC
ncbi:hypothetical protein F5B20DRAFT_559371, partial [Whalleya microplaca]